MDQQLTDLIDALIATDESPSSWGWQASPGSDDDGYMDVSLVGDGEYRWEIGDAGAVASLDLTLDQLRDIHRRLTVQLAVATRQQA